MRSRIRAISSFLFFILLMSFISGSSLGDPPRDLSFDEIKVCNSPATEPDCESMSCLDQCLKEEGTDSEECKLSCNLST